MAVVMKAFDAFRSMRRRQTPTSVPTLSVRPMSIVPESPTVLPVRLPVLNPTVGPFGHERLIAVRCMKETEVVVRGSATGREYRFAPGEARDIPLSDARILVTEGDFAFSGGR